MKSIQVSVGSGTKDITFPNCSTGFADPLLDGARPITVSWVNMHGNQQLIYRWDYCGFKIELTTSVVGSLHRHPLKSQFTIGEPKAWTVEVSEIPKDKPKSVIKIGPETEQKLQEVYFLKAKLCNLISPHYADGV